jgi:hypothetical protein
MMRAGLGPCCGLFRNPFTHSGYPMAKKSRGGRMTAAKNRAAKSKGGKGPVKNRPAGRHIMKT